MTHLLNHYKKLLALTLLLKGSFGFSQLSIEASFSLLNDKNFNTIASETYGVGFIPKIDNRFSISGHLLLEEKWDKTISPYIAIQVVDRKINYSYINGPVTGFHLGVIEVPIGLRLRKQISSNSALRLNIGAGANYVLTKDAKTNILFKDDEQEFRFQFVSTKPLNWFSQAGIGFESKASEHGIFSASLNYQLQFTDLFYFKANTRSSINTFNYTLRSSGVRTSYLSLSVAYAFSLRKAVTQKKTGYSHQETAGFKKHISFD